MWLLLALACSPLDDHTRSIVKEVIRPTGLSADEVRLFEVGLVGPDTRVEPFAPEAFGEDSPETLTEHPIDEEATLYLVDWLPDARWAHAAEWVWVADDGTVLQDEVHEWFPVVDDEPFLPNAHEPVWGVPQEEDGPVDDLESVLPSSRSGTPPATGAIDATCPEDGKDVAFTFTTWRSRPTQKDVTRFNGYIAGIAGYTTYTIQAVTGTNAQRESRVLAFLDRVAAEQDDVDDLVIQYAGHGSSYGTLVVGHHQTDWAEITPSELATKVQAIDPRTVTLVLDSCYSRTFGNRFQTAMAASEAGRRPDVRVLSAANTDEQSWGDAVRGGWFSEALNDEYLSTWDQPDWDSVEIAPIPTTKKHQVYVRLQNGRPVLVTVEIPWQQTFGRTFLPFAVPRITVPEPATVGEICTAAELEPQDYDRQLRLDGEAIGVENVRVTAQSTDGTWEPLELVFSSDTNAVFHIPMRRDGFPSDGCSRDITPQEAGIYLVRVENDAGVSDARPVQVVAQEYTQTYVPGPDTEWAELWHPFTDATPWTAGGTVQLSSLRYDTELQPSYTPADGNALHTTSPGLQATPGWGFDLLPADRDLATAYEQGFPDFRYYGFRVVFGDSYPLGDAWEYTLVYD